jgi:hypothetical protein
MNNEYWGEWRISFFGLRKKTDFKIKSIFDKIFMMNLQEFVDRREL